MTKDRIINRVLQLKKVVDHPRTPESECNNAKALIDKLMKLHDIADLEVKEDVEQWYDLMARDYLERIVLEWVVTVYDLSLYRSKGAKSKFKIKCNKELYDIISYEYNYHKDNVAAYAEGMTYGYCLDNIGELPESEKTEKPKKPKKAKTKPKDMRFRRGFNMSDYMGKHSPKQQLNYKT